MLRRPAHRILSTLLRTAPVRTARLPAPPMALPVALRTAARFQSSNTSNTAQLKVPNPEYMIAFTCKQCDTRSSHTMSKQAYHEGTVLITCPGCQNRHLIADHLKIFSDDRITIQDILSAKGESISQSTDDLVFDQIPEKLRGLIGHHAKDAPESTSTTEEEDQSPRTLPEGKN